MNKRTSRSFHKLRLAGKEYRYAVEASEAVVEMPLSPSIRAHRTLQDQMGAVHDVEVVIDTIERRAKDNKRLARSARQMVKLLKDDRDERIATFEEFVSTQPVWTKKFKLTLPDE